MRGCTRSRDAGGAHLARRLDGACCFDSEAAEVGLDDKALPYHLHVSWALGGEGEGRRCRQVYGWGVGATAGEGEAVHLDDIGRGAIALFLFVLVVLVRQRVVPG